MARLVLLTDDAAADLEDICGYIGQHDSAGAADRVLTRIEATLERLVDAPDRGRYPPELAALGIRTYREIFFKPHRIVYRVLPDAVLVLLITDGRRDLQTLLERRLLGA